MRRDLGGVADAPSAPAEARACSDPLAAAEVIRSVVAEAVWAPSVHNTQPWCFTADGPRLRLHADVGRQLTAADPDGREMMISCGAALFTARLALRSLGYVPETQVLPDPADPTLVAQLSWPRRAAVTEYERRLFSQVRRRRTHRGGFDPVPLSPALLAALREGAARDGATLRIVADDGRRAMLAAAVETAERALRLDSDRVVLHTREAGDLSILLRKDTRYLKDGQLVEAGQLQPTMRVFVRAGKDVYEQVEAYQVIWGTILTPH